ncbi:MAG: hypothetical protein HPY59_03390 [Anaerolineae bacterium]|nr:hypothetical protein [Anaerolineae bacterium]
MTGPESVKREEKISHPAPCTTVILRAPSDREILTLAPLDYCDPGD